MPLFGSSITEHDYYHDYKQEQEKAERLADKVELLLAALQECEKLGERDIQIIVDKTREALQIIDGHNQKGE